MEPGTALLVGVEAEQREDQIRYTATSIKPLDAALENKIREIEIHLSDPAPAKKVKEFLDIEGQGHAHINFFIQVEGERVAHLKLPGRWSLSAQARNIIRTEPGVIEIAEA